MGLIDRIKADAKRFSSDANGFGINISFTAPSAETATIVGLATKHHLSVGTDGLPVNSKNAHISFSEDLLTAASYPVRTSGEVNLKGHKVSWIDSTGVAKNYVIEQWFPDETVGFIVCILGDFE